MLLTYLACLDLELTIVIDASRHEAAVALLIQHGADVRAKDDKLKAQPHSHSFAQHWWVPTH
jgi:hypothetical protein